VLVVSIDIFKGFSDRGGFSFIPQPSFSDRHWIIYGTLVVPRIRIIPLRECPRKTEVRHLCRTRLAGCQPAESIRMIDFLQCLFAIWIIAKTIVAKKITANAARKIAENINQAERDAAAAARTGYGAQDDVFVVVADDPHDFRAVERVDHPWVHGWPERFHLYEDRFTDELASALAAARGIEFCQEPGVDGEGNQFLTFCADVWHGFRI
jgi:hypothetical protein